MNDIDKLIEERDYLLRQNQELWNRIIRLEAEIADQKSINKTPAHENSSTIHKQTS